MRVTIRLDEKLHGEAKRAAAEDGKTLSTFVEESLQAYLQPRGRSGEPRRLKLHTFGVGGVLPGVEINNSAALLDIMDEEDMEKYRRTNEG